MASMRAAISNITVRPVAPMAYLSPESATRRKTKNAL